MSSVSNDVNGVTLRITHGSEGVTYDSPNRLTLSLPNGWNSKGDNIALDSLYLYNSWNNITAAKGNNSFSYRWTDGVTYPVVLSGGIYSFDDLNYYLQDVMYANNHYLVDDAGEEVYYLALEMNPVSYAISVTSTPIPTVLETGWTNPGGVDLTPSTGPQLFVPSTAFATLVAFTPGTYPTTQQSTVYQINSNNGVPQITDVTSINVLCNVVGRNLFQNSTAIATFTTAGVAAGAQIAYTPNNLSYYKVAETIHTSITVTFVDQLNRPLQIRDTAGWTVILKIRK